MPNLTLSNYYEKAITSANENEFIHLEALANRLAAKFYLSKGFIKNAKTYMIEARYLYQKWGAEPKVSDLESKYTQILMNLRNDLFTRRMDSTMTISSTHSVSGGIDLGAAMKASQAISREFVLDKLLRILMKILLENSGAERGFLIIEDDGSLKIEAECEIGREEDSTLLSLPLESCPAVSSAVINYVKRTNETLILNDAVNEGLFTRDPYIVDNKPKSILCLPIMHHGKMTRILYLENNLTVGAFTEDRLEVLQLLSSQVAISIENARLYSEVEELRKPENL